MKSFLIILMCIPVVTPGLQIWFKNFGNTSDKRDMALCRNCSSCALLEKQNIVDYTGTINLDRFPYEVKSKIAAKCDKVKNANICYRSSSTTECIESIVESYELQIASKCANEIIRGAFKPFMMNKDPNNYEPEDACYHRCVFLKTGIMNKNNELARVVYVPKQAEYDIMKNAVAINTCHNNNMQEDICIQAIKRKECMELHFKSMVAKSHYDANTASSKKIRAKDRYGNRRY